MKSILASTAVAMTALLAITGCSSQSAAPATDSSPTAVSIPSEPVKAAPLDKAAAALLPADVLQKGALTAVTDPTFAPFQFYGEDTTKIIGWTADMVTALGQTLGVETGVQAAAFDTILPGIASGKYDLAVSAFTVTPERLKNADFISWVMSGTGVGVQPGNPLGLSTDPLTLCGHKIAASKGTSQALEILPRFNKACTDAGKPEIAVSLFPSGNEALLALTSRRIDGLLNDTIGMAYESKLTGGQFEVAEGADIDTVACGFALAKNSPLTPAFSAAMKTLIENGTYDAVNEKWGFPKTAAISADKIDN